MWYQNLGPVIGTDMRIFSYQLLPNCVGDAVRCKRHQANYPNVASWDLWGTNADSCSSEMMVQASQETKRPGG